MTFNIKIQENEDKHDILNKIDKYQKKKNFKI